MAVMASFVISLHPRALSDSSSAQERATAVIDASVIFEHFSMDRLLSLGHPLATPMIEMSVSCVHRSTDSRFSKGQHLATATIVLSMS
jgi:hypothetical protein